MARPTWQKFGLIAAVGVLGGLLGAGALRLYERHGCGVSPLMRPDISCAEATHVTSATYDKLESEIRVRLAQSEGQGKANHVGVYFQRLRDGIGFGIHDDSMFAPASLLKLPIAFAVMMLEAHSPGTLAQELPYTEAQAHGFEIPPQNIVASPGLERGKSYSIERLLHATITHSDNLAYYILIAYLAENAERQALVTRTFRELGIRDPQQLEQDAASVREYAGLFRVLYNSSYLDAASSQKLLSWLSESTYDAGIAAGTPRGVMIANKFGERASADGTHQLHDCGIVYDGDEPYVLCVMTKGRDFAALAHVVADVSNAVYSSVASRAL